MIPHYAMRCANSRYGVANSDALYANDPVYQVWRQTSAALQERADMNTAGDRVRRTG